jgi:hypothetical protein
MTTTSFCCQSTERGRSPEGSSLVDASLLFSGRPKGYCLEDASLLFRGRPEGYCLEDANAIGRHKVAIGYWL